MIKKQKESVAVAQGRTQLFDESSFNQKTYVKSDVIYGYDLDETLDILKKVAVESGGSASYEFYHACLDRLDILITERNSVVKKDEVVRILRVLSYFRPRDYERADK